MINFPAIQPPLERRRHFRNTNFVGDIAGAQPDTVKHAIRTNRVTNPLNPVREDKKKSRATYALCKKSVGPPFFIPAKKSLYRSS